MRLRTSFFVPRIPINNGKKAKEDRRWERGRYRGLCHAVTTMVIGFLGGRRRAKEQDRTEEEAIRGGVRCLLREELIRICDRCLERGSVRIHSLESLDDLLKQYTALGGNGAVRKLVEDVKKLEVK